ncbi:MAG: hypothetical protein F4W89_02205 [Acidobacteria bacterium]|nr:hypothetical protein [Acidobacteriota bacterium]
MPSPQEHHEVEALPFRVDPHMLEDLGLNLYSSLPRVLVEFIANAYDADASHASISMDFQLIRQLRAEMRQHWRQLQDAAKATAAAGETPPDLAPLEEGLLPEAAVIAIQDNGHGMSLDQLRNRFLVAGRRRRLEEGNRSPGGRVLMGRKGVGKLAGFGVARSIEVVSKVKGDDYAHSIHLDFDRIMELPDSREVKVPTFRVDGDAGLGDHGTRVTFSRLVHESVKSQEETVRRSVGDHFFLIDPQDFNTCLNGTAVAPTARGLAYAWPEAGDLSICDLVTHSIDIPETQQRVEFQYRLRFVEDRAALRGSERGVRVYAHKRLAAAPSLLHADTNMHGFRMTDYLDGVVYADFIDEHKQDYIATDRQGLRWETPLLQPMHDFLGAEIKEACKNYQRVRDARRAKEVDEDAYTAELIASAQLSSREKRLARAVCSRLASFHREGVTSEAYREHAQLLVGAIGKGEIFTAISGIAERDNPRLHDLTVEVTKLTHAEIDQTLGVVRSRLVAIKTLQRIIRAVNFRHANNEDDLHLLLKENPWLIDPTYFEFLTSNLANKTFFDRLEAKLKIGAAVPSDYDKTCDDEALDMRENRRPDLVFLLVNSSLKRVVIVELKAPNTRLLHKHLVQLEDYMDDTRRFLKSLDRTDVVVEGCLIGSLELGAQALEVRRLERQIGERGSDAKWVVFDLLELLERTCNAHQEILEIHEKVESEETVT